ncbi:uncharacterized protein LAESUDRAFT_810112 [Laetiporus sulphureus 93-53]|uniref:ribonuclease Z n=1 Tax=Laetiporus sulphureus 93-53 TaxID=1314785 RepID=A0A165GL05_9APHY|nr:uncharacterized protein LAESUDRAFT_810112 [Laetiporus sulphureus 93-53]KZT10496.1 hypothetical protein LAESUDRAFT_810112 [Laetiporus sulphureus 93-53]
MNWSVSVVSTATSDTEPTIIVTFDNGKYVFNAGENTGRTWTQSRRHWRKSKGLFVTSVGTQQCAGLTGVLMFFADGLMKGLDVVGPQGLTHYLASMRHHMFRSGFSVKCVEIPPAPSSSADTEPAAPVPVFKDENVTVYGIPIYPTPPDAIVSTSSAKRKRSPLPSKRPAMAGIQYKSPLPGVDAQEYRRLTVENMFPRLVQPPGGGPPKDPDEQKQGKGKRHKQQVDAKSAKMVAGPEPPPPLMEVYNEAYAHKNKYLPPFEEYGLDMSKKMTACYVLVGPRTRGKFDAKKAETLGVFRTDRAKLIKGQTVTITIKDADGNEIQRIVKPEDCIAQSEIPKVMLLLDVPTPTHIPQVVATFTENPFYSRFHSKSENDQSEYRVHIIYHLCGPGVLEDERYKAFMRGFANHVNHQISSREHGPDPVTFTSAAFSQLRLHQLDADMFPLPQFSLVARRDLSSVTGLPAKAELLSPNRIVMMRPLTDPCDDEEIAKYDLFHPVITSGMPVSLPESISNEFAAAKARVQRHVDERAQDKKPGDDVEVIPLGTSSAVPSKYRNVSSTLIRIPNWGNILLDAGEGTWGQLTRMFGDDIDNHTTGAWDVLRNLKFIFLSHMHGDHHVGTAKLLAMRKLLKPSPNQALFIVGNRNHEVYLRDQSSLEDLGLSGPGRNGVIFMQSGFFHWFPPEERKELMENDTFQRFEIARKLLNSSWAEPSLKSGKEMCRALGLESFQTLRVNHGGGCYAVILKHQDGWSIVYSADTPPDAVLAAAGENCKLLIHEATLADGQEDLALAKKHSTFSQARKIGEQMKAENLLLTHFSARFPKIMLGDDGKIDELPHPTLALAVDHVRFVIGDMWKLGVYSRAVEGTIFETNAEEGGDEDDELPSGPW